jgi:prepilin-type N-terminal cleavage/methylation domain-containing protein
MKIFSAQQRIAGGARAWRGRAFTLAEMMIAMLVFTLMMAAYLYANLFGMRQNELVESMLGASQSSRQGFEQMLSDIRSAKVWNLGDGSFTTFTQITNDAVQMANALQISLTSATNQYIRYWLDTNNFQLCRMHSGDTSPTIIAPNLTNSLYFYGEDFRGNLQTNLTEKYVIHVRLQFVQYQYPLTKVGPGYLYDYYKMEFRATPHAPD